MIEGKQQQVGKQLGKQLRLTKFIFLTALVCTSLFFLSCADENKKKIEQSIKKNLLQNLTELKKTNEQKNFKSAIDFDDFDKVCIVLPYSTTDKISKALGFPHTTSIGGDDSKWGLILVKNN